MDEKHFKEMIRFAIGREIDSVHFYTEASARVTHTGARELFQDFARQEEGHKTKLEGVFEGKVSLTQIEKVPDLKISDYLVETSLKPGIPYADTLRIAMKREERSVKLYTDLKNQNQDERLISLFNFLIQEESKHKFHLEKLYDDEILK